MNTIHQKSFLGVKNVGFTLIELLVVVLIIGILSAIALPQYHKAVAKARATEVAVWIKHCEDAMRMYILSNGWPREFILPTDLGIEFPGENPDYYSSEHFEYGVYCDETVCYIDVWGGVDDMDPQINIRWAPGGSPASSSFNSCSWETDYGRAICQALGYDEGGNKEVRPLS